MDRSAKVELFEELRRGHAAGETIQGLATKYGVHRRMVREVFVPQRYEQGQEGQLDWFEAVVKLAGRVAHTAVLQQRKWILSRVQNVCHFSRESVTFNKDCFAESLF
jgi:hypothetical protein